MPSLRSLAGLCLLLFAVPSAAEAAPPRPARAAAAQVGTTVDTQNGRVVGCDSSTCTLGGNFLFFGGIPFAAPPLHDLRFAAPQPVAPWSGPLDATHFHAIFDPAKQAYVVNNLGCVQAAGGNEDCLYVNLYVPTGLTVDSHVPVMVFFHGAGNKANSAQGINSNLTSLPARGVIVVTVDFRLGGLGWVAFDELPAAASNGLLNRIAALTWVKENIGSFGGDSHRVMLFGISAGAADIIALLGSPLAHGLFQRAAVESGPTFTNSLADSQAAGRKVEAAVGCTGAADVVACLRGLDARTVNQAALALTYAYSPVIDDVALETPPLDWIAHHGAVPIIVGSNTDEWQFFYPIADFITAGVILTDAGFLANIEASVPNQCFAETYQGMYDAMSYPATDFYGHAFTAWAGDFNVTCPARALARAASTAKHGAPVYKYLFSHALSVYTGPQGQPVTALADRGAFHTLETYFVMGAPALATIKSQNTKAVLTAYPYASPTTPTAADVALSDAIQGYWTRFAATGDPNGAGAPTWPAYDAATDGYLRLDDSIVTGSGLSTAECDYWDHPVCPQ